MILDDIAAKRREQLDRDKARAPFEQVKAAALCMTPARDFKAALKKSGSLAVIAEVKKASPSKGLICADFRPADIARRYEAAGADAVSVLTEEHFFKGSAEYLKAVKKAVSLPVLRKDFIIDEYQIYEARAMGADAILLIAAMLDENTLKAFYQTARNLGLYCLAEAHNEEELNRVLGAGCDIVGVNNRDLKTFHVDLNTTARLAAQLPAGTLLVAESGVKTRADTQFLQKAGASAVLIGETLMRSGDVASALAGLRP